MRGASVEVLLRRQRYGGRKGRSAKRRLGRFKVSRALLLLGAGAMMFALLLGGAIV